MAMYWGCISKLNVLMCMRGCRMNSWWNGKIGKPIGKEDTRIEKRNAICVDDAGAIVYGLVIYVSYIKKNTNNQMIQVEWEMGNTQTW